MGKTVSKDIAQADVNKWLDYKKIGESKRNSNQGQIDSLVDAISEGNLIVNEDMSITHVLKFPLDGETTVTELKYKARMNSEAVLPHLNGVKPTDVDGRMVAYTAALTSQLKAIIKKLDTEDSTLAHAVVVFFL
jgi:hypothetical protein